MNLVRKVSVTAIALLGAAALSGCGTLQSDWNSLTSQQKVTLVAQVVNGACVLSAAGIAYAGAVNSIINPNSANGGKGASAAGTILKASQIDTLTCQSLNGVTATLLAAGQVQLPSSVAAK